jgi:hypothetical protein
MRMEDRFIMDSVRMIEKGNAGIIAYKQYKKEIS